MAAELHTRATRRTALLALALAAVALPAALVSCALLSGASDLTFSDGPGDASDDTSSADAARDAPTAIDASADAPPTRDADAAGPCDEPGLVARWTFDEGAGLEVHDCTSFHHNGLVAGGFWSSGERDGGMTFDGGWVSMGNPADMQLTGPLTACAWVHPATQPPGGLRSYIVGKLSNPSGGGWRLGIGPVAVGSSTASLASANVPNGDGGNGETAGGTVANGAWAHVCMVYEPSGQAVFIDGKEVVRNAAPFPKITPTTDDLRIGARADGSNPFIGVIDDVRIYTRALTAQELATLAQP
jgi:hypothetical protein